MLHKNYKLEKLTSSPVTTLNDIYDTKVMSKVKSVINDTSHPQYNCYPWLVKKDFVVHVPCKTKYDAESFVPTSFKILKKNM